MSKRNKPKLAAPAALPLCFLAVFWSSEAALAQGYPVIDSAAVTQAVNNLKAATQQVQELNAMLGQVQSMVQTVGKQGLPTLLFQEALSQSGISQYGPPVKDLLESANSVWGAASQAVAAGQQTANSFKDVLAEADRLKGQIGSLAKKPDFSNFAATQSWVKQELTVAKDANLTAVNLTRKARSMLAGEAAANAYAMALNARSQVSTMTDRAKTLAQQANGSKDLRGDMEANTAVMLAMHDELAHLQALMAAMLEVQSAARLAEMDPTVSSAGATASPTGSSQN